MNKRLEEIAKRKLEIRELAYIGLLAARALLKMAKYGTEWARLRAFTLSLSGEDGS